MKNIVIPFLGLFGFLFSLNSFADQLTGATTMNTITQVVNSMAENGIIDVDVAKYRISYYHDQIFVYGTNLATVMTGSEDWARSELSNVISKRLYTLKDQWFLTKEKYNTYILRYSGMTSTGSALQFWIVYKDFVTFEKDIRENEVSRTQEALYNTFKDRLTILLKARRITQEKYNVWLEKIQIQVYQYKSDPDTMSADFEAEAARYTDIIPCAPCSSDCTSGTQTPNCSNPNATPPDYSNEVTIQYWKIYTKMPVKKLQLTLMRARKLEKKYREGSKNKLKIQLQIALLNQEITKKTNTSSIKK